MCCTKTKTHKTALCPGTQNSFGEKKREGGRGLFIRKLCQPWFLQNMGLFVYFYWSILCFLNQEIYQSLFNHTFFFSIWPNLVHVLPSCWVSAERSHVDSGGVQDLQCVFCEGGNGKLNSQIRHYSETWENTRPTILTSSHNEKIWMKMWFSAIMGEEFYEDNSVSVIIIHFDKSPTVGYY